jgi:quercetin dioxygenase-like cupin family protein
MGRLIVASGASQIKIRIDLGLTPSASPTTVEVPVGVAFRPVVENDHGRGGNTEKRERSSAMKSMVFALCLAASTAAAQDAKVTPLMTRTLVGIAGKEAAMVTVEYAPGASSAEHRHNAHTFVYVLEGSVVMQVKGGAEVTLGPGQTFYESPEDVHSVSRNASKTKPAKFLVFFVKDLGAPATVPAK